MATDPKQGNQAISLINRAKATGNGTFLDDAVKLLQGQAREKLNAALLSFRRNHAKCYIFGGGSQDQRCRLCKAADLALGLSGHPDNALSPAPEPEPFSLTDFRPDWVQVWSVAEAERLLTAAGQAFKFAGSGWYTTKDEAILVLPLRGLQLEVDGTDTTDAHYRFYIWTVGKNLIMELFARLGSLPLRAQKEKA